MTWFGSPVYYAALGVAVAIRLGVDWWLLHTGRIVHYKVVPHRKLRAAGHVSDRARIGGAAVSTSSETPHPAPGLRIPLPGAGLTPGVPTGDAVADTDPGSRAMGDTLTGPCSVSEPCPAAQTATPPVSMLVADSRSGLGPQQPVTVKPPDWAVAGSQPHPRDEEVADAVRPRLTASATGSMIAGAVAQTAPARSPA